jgi:hypothetical protein
MTGVVMMKNIVEIGIEVLGHVARPIAHTGGPIIDAVPVPAKAVEVAPPEAAMIPPPRPRLVAQGKSRTKGVAAYLVTRLF